MFAILDSPFGIRGLCLRPKTALGIEAGGLGTSTPQYPAFAPTRLAMESATGHSLIHG